MEEKTLLEIKIIGGYKDEADVKIVMNQAYIEGVAALIVEMAKDNLEFRAALADAMFGAKTGK